MHRMHGGVILAATLFFVACGSDSPESAVTEPTEVPAASGDTVSSEPPSGGTVDACVVLGSLDLAGLLGEPAGELVDNSDEFAAVCRAEAANGESSGGVNLTISADSAASNFERQQEQAGVDSEVGGLGDEAFHSGPMIVVLDGETLVMLSAVQDRDLGAGGVTDAALEAAAAQVLVALD